MDDSVDEPSDHKNGTVDESSMYDASEKTSYLETYDMTASADDTSPTKPAEERGVKPPDLIIHFHGHKIPTHRAVLIEQCEYFKILLTDYKDAREVNVEYDVHVDIFIMILDYIRTEEIEITISNVRDITRCARHFMLDNLLGAAFDFKVSNFELIFKNGSFLNWQLASVQQVLRSDRVIVSKEKKILLFALKWINHDFDQRRRNGTELLHFVRFSRISKEDRDETIGKFVLGVPAKLLTKTTPPRQYHKGIYVFGRNDSFQRYCPFDGSVTALDQPLAMTSFENAEFLSNNDKIYVFDRYTSVKMRGENFVHHVYDPIKDNWSKESASNHEIVQFFNRNPLNFSIVYCSFSGVVYALVKCLNKVKVFMLHVSDAWVANSQSQITLSGLNSRSPLESATACGDSIYVIMAVTSNILRYSVVDDEWEILPTPYELGNYQTVAYKISLFFNYKGHRVSYDTVTRQFKEYVCPRIADLPHITLYNGAIYFIADETTSSMDGLKAYQVQKLDPSFLKETISLIGPSVPYLITDMRQVEHITSIY